ncbi:MAG: acyltransferase [Ruminococcus sp.]|nr:acyltransferase [Ruminococcus sp.]
MDRKKVDFSREDTKAVKGIAVAMMLFHHLAGFAEQRSPVGFEGFKKGFLSKIDDNYITNIAVHCKLCVAIFFFLGGYGIYKQMSANKFSLTESIVGLYKRYWKIFLIFVPIAFIFFRRSEDVTYLSGRYNLREIPQYITTILSNFTMLSNTINMEWWFMKTYVCAIVLGTVFSRLLKKKNNFASELLIAFGTDILFRNLLPSLASNVPALKSLFGNFFYTSFFSEASAISPFFVGIVMAKYNGLIRLKEIISRVPFRFLIGLVGMPAVLWSRCYIYGEGLDCIYAVFFTVFVSLFLDGIKPLRKAISFVGKHSTNMWLIHAFYCYYFLEATKIVYCTRNVWIDFLILFAMSLVSSIIVELFYGLIGLITRKIKNIIENFKAKKAEFPYVPADCFSPVAETDTEKNIPADCFSSVAETDTEKEISAEDNITSSTKNNQ